MALVRGDSKGVSRSLIIDSSAWVRLSTVLDGSRSILGDSRESGRGEAVSSINECSMLPTYPVE